jgi:hypothetical protein
LIGKARAIGIHITKSFVNFENHRKLNKKVSLSIMKIKIVEMGAQAISGKPCASDYFTKRTLSSVILLQ